MARIVGVEIPGGKRIDIALRYIYGLGPANAKVILSKAGIDPAIRAKDLNNNEFVPDSVHAIQEATGIVHRRRSRAVRWRELPHQRLQRPSNAIARSAPLRRLARSRQRTSTNAASPPGKGPPKTVGVAAQPERQTGIH